MYFEYFKNFTDLYINQCHLLKNAPIYKEHFEDLDKIYKIVQGDTFLIEALTKKRTLVDYSLFEHSDKLPHDKFLTNLSIKIILVYQNLDKIIQLIESMENNFDKDLNKWKLDQIEKVLFLGWDKYCKISIDKAIKYL